MATKEHTEDKQHIITEHQILDSRSSGVLLHVSSLPGSFGIGDFGPSARHFIDFLAKAGQKYWQILPLNATYKEAGHSPYSSQGAFSMNPLFIDPLHLHEMGLIDDEALEKERSKVKSRIDYKAAQLAKGNLLSIAYNSFSKGEAKEMIPEFLAFVDKESYWLEDFAYFTCISRVFKGTPWYEWPEKYKNRDTSTLKAFRRQYHRELREIYFQQFLAWLHWNITKKNAAKKGVWILGDMPIYVAYNSADVWSRPDLFDLKKDKRMANVAGVPPDYFNEDGQRWNMPLFRWDQLEKEGFEWFLKRIAKNLEWVDLLRLDHFRGYSAYWQIPEEAPTAKNGEWIKGPGEKLFRAIKERFPAMPFIAEDLGDIDQDVYDLRDAFKLPGMKVIQFGFGKKLKTQEHHPLNISSYCLAYTGTHDNNTLIGWYKQDIDRKTRKRVEKTVGKKVKKSQVHLALIRTLFATRSLLTIVPMQDWLGLDGTARMNYPSTTTGNWEWRLKSAYLNKEQISHLKKITGKYGRS